MSNYTKSTNFATKDNLPTGDPLKIVKGTEINTEFDNISTAIATKTDNSSAAITGGTITGITDLAIADGGTGASTATAALNNLLPSQTSAANKYLQSDGTNASWDAVSLSTADITGTLAVANGGTGVTSSTGTGSTVLSNSPTLVTPTLGTPASATLTNATGLPISTGVSGLGTGVATALSVNTGQNNAVVLFNGALGTPSSGTVTNLTGTASININGTVGAVGPASGSFTTLTSSSTVTINGGTANGIGYLNGSKVFTTGAVLKFDGTNITSDRSVGTVYSGTSFSTWANGIILNNSATPATGLLDSIYFTNNANMQNVFGVAQNASGYGDFVWAGYAGTYTEWMKLTSAGLSITGTLSASSTATLNTLSSSGATLTGGTINGMTIGATTASTGAFTTLAASSTVTLSGGTANGVTYLNGSKVLTSGSALTFDGTNLNLGVNGATLYWTATGNNVAINTSSGVMGFYTGTSAYGLAQQINADGTTFWKVGGSEQMRLNSTGLGIGTSSPVTSLDVRATNGATIIAGRTANTGTGSEFGYFASYAPNASGTDIIWSQIKSLVSTATAGSEANSIVFSSRTAGSFTEKLRIDSAGNLGLGVTPSAWVGNTAMQVGSLGAIASSTTTPVAISANAYSTSAGWAAKYITSSTASLYLQQSGQHKFFTAASGTAGDVISFTQAMTLDASGRLGIATTSPLAPLQINSFGGLDGNGNQFYITNNQYYDSVDARDESIKAGYSNRIVLDNNAGGILFQTTSTSAAGANTAVTLTERAKITSDGNLLVNSLTSTPASITAHKLVVERTASVFAAAFGYVTDSTARTQVTFYNSNGSVGTITTNGSATAYNTSSDQRLKENIVDAPEFGSVIDSIQVRSFDWKTDQTHQRAGFIAQELIIVAPEAVHQPEDTGGMMAVDYSKLVPMLVKEVQSLRARVAQLETN